jgi:GT2 family glycosyltransferase
MFAYHEDLDLGWRLMLAGYRNVLAPQSVVRHRYEFSRSISKWFWMERNRTAVVLKNYKWQTLLFLAPQLLVVDLLILSFAISGGWWREKLRAMAWFWKPSTWIYIVRGRKELQKIRKLPDRMILEMFTPVIAYQEFESPFMTKFANPMLTASYALLKMVVKW